MMYAGVFLIGFGCGVVTMTLVWLWVGAAHYARCVGRNALGQRKAPPRLRSTTGQ